MEEKILSVAKDGSLVLPREFMDKLMIQDQLLCRLDGDSLVLIPSYEERLKKSKSLLEALKEEGYQGEELFNKLMEAKARLEK